MKKYILFVLFALTCGISFGKMGPGQKKKKSTTINLREDCVEGTQQAIQNINNVRATLLNSGDVWWNLQEGQYFVPQVPPGEEATSSIFAGAVWIGGFEPVEGGQDILKIAANTYRTNNGTDFYPGPLDDNSGATEKEICEDWDRFFRVTGKEIDQHRLNYFKFSGLGQDYPKDSIPDNVLYWPGVGNVDFAEKYEFTLPSAGQGLGSFYDHPDSELDVYDPANGDYPIIEVRGCEAFAQYPDEMFFWIYNDQGGPHEATDGSAIQMEVQVQAFAYQSNDELNDMTFQRYKLINRAQTVIKDCYFAMWVDGDLGCSEDDFIGCDTSRSLAILYNQDELDGEGNGCDCGGVATYCADIPLLGVDYFRGPLKPQVWEVIDGDSILMDLSDVFQEPDTFVELGMSSFAYTNRQGAGEHPPGTFDAQTAEEHYNLLDGKWRDGTPITFGNSGYNPGNTDTVRYVLPSPPTDGGGWSMCSADLGEGDRRTIQASGPFILKQGAVNELIIGVVWVPDQVYPCPELGDLNKADDLAQALFDNCFQTLDGPDGPDVDVIELDREVIVLLTNDTLLSNNSYEEYSEVDIFATDEIAKALPDSAKSYVFEGYIIYQLINSTATSDLADIDKARIVRQIDLENGITKLYNWESEVNPLPGGEGQLIYTPEVATIGNDSGLKHSFRITQDAFDQGDGRLVNHREYYFLVLAYGYNEYEEFDPTTGLGQRRPFIAGRRNFGVVTVVPRPMVYDELNTFYGDGPQVTRLSGVGNQGGFLELEDDMYDKILDNDEEATVVYKSGSGPLAVKIVNPLDVKDAKFKLEIKGSFDDDDGELEEGNNSRWILTDTESGKVFQSERNLDKINERIIREYGISLNIHRNADVSDFPQTQASGEFIGATVEYENETENRWLQFLPNGGFAGFQIPLYNFVDNDDRAQFDPTGDFTSTSGVNMIPWKITSVDGPIITPGFRNNTSIAGLAKNQMSMGDLNNVDIVFTSNKDDWSRCIVLETSHVDFYDVGYEAEGSAEQFEVRDAKSVTKEADSDGNAREEDGETGFGWFPGYAVDVETGERLNIFFGENSVYGGDYADEVGGEFGRDMMFNPDDRLVIPTPEGNIQSIFDLYTGGQHTIYVTRTEYDGCETYRDLLEEGSSTPKKIRALRTITWTGIPMVAQGEELLSYGDGLIPNKTIVKLRVDNRYGEELEFDGSSFDVVNGNPVYEFELRGKEATAVDGATIDEALANVNAVPNPYYGNSTYELGQNDARVKITNIPSRSTITIYSIDGRFIGQFKRDARRENVNRTTAGVNFRQEEASVVWNLKNSAGIPVSSGVYLIHVLDEDTGAQRTIKWFGINRKFDPSGL